MPAVVERFERGPITYPAKAVITGGRLVQANAAGTGVEHAAADSLSVLGVAKMDATNVSTEQSSQSALNTDVTRNEVAVVRHGMVKCEYAAAATFGQRLRAAANGMVQPLGVNTLDQCIGYCAKVGGAAINSRSDTFINIVGR